MRAYQPDWSPDGAWIAFTGYLEGQPYGVYAVPSAGGTPQRITPPGGLDGTVNWSPDGNTLLFHHTLPHDLHSGVAGRQGLCLLDWKTRKISPLPGSIDWARGRWSPDGSRIAATDDSQIQIFEMRTQRWKHLADAKGVGNILWSRNGRYLYFQADLVPEQPIFRVAANADENGGQVERLMSSKQIPQSDVSRYVLTSLDSDDSPIASIVRSNADIYALDLDLP
jgi:Tol biopolymer transport system component